MGYTSPRRPRISSGSGSGGGNGGEQYMIKVKKIITRKNLQYLLTVGVGREGGGGEWEGKVREGRRKE